MSMILDGCKLQGGRRGIRAAILAQVALLVTVGTASAPAHADNGSLYVAPGPTTVITPDMIRRNQEQSQGTTRKLGDLLGSSLSSSSRHATELVVTVQCGHYKSATITYADGSAKTLNLSNAPANQRDMDQAKAAIPILRIVEMGGCDS